MLGREVWGWRILVVMLICLTVPTITNSTEIETAWQESINPADESPNDLLNTNNGTDDSQSDNEGEASSEDQNDASEDASSDDQESTAGAEADVQFSDEDTQQEESANGNDESEIVAGDESDKISSLVLPATQIIALTMMAIMAVGLLTSTATAIIISEASRLGIFLAIFGPLIAITQRGEGGIFTRGRILGFIEAHPGIHFSALRDALALGNGVTAHHLQVLEKEGRTISWPDGKVRRFASSGIDQHRLKELQSPVTGMQVAILKLLSDAGTIGIKSGELRIRLETSRQLLSYHMKQLSEREFVKSTGRGRAVRWNLLSEGRKHLESATHLSEV